jgi:fimbrial isopeptide formation D2 family protein
MAYKYEVEKKANSVKVRVLIAVYVMFVVSSILIGVAVRLQQLQNIRPVDPKADSAGNPSAAVISQASDPTYSVRQVEALAYCDVVNTQGQPVGLTLPLAASFTFREIKRDVGQYGTALSTVCTNASAGICNWKTPADTDSALRCRNGQTVAQCSSDSTVCNDTAIPGGLFFYHTVKSSTVANYSVQWPETENLGNLVYDNNEVDVILNPNMGDLAGNSIVRNGVTYIINKSSLTTQDTNSLFPIYQWRCDNDVCTGTGDCTNAGINYSAQLCTFNSATRLFECQPNRYVRYGRDIEQTYYYNITNWAGQVAGDPTWVKTGYAYESLVGSSYENALPGPTDNKITFKGNLIKYRYTCQAANATTPTVSTPTPSTVISAQKRGPACVERVSPNNVATFTITVTNNGTAATVIRSIEDALPQGFTYRSNTTLINGSAVSDTYTLTTNSGTSVKITFSPPSGQAPFTINPGQVFTVVFSTYATGNAVTGVNTNRVVVSPEGADAIDNISWQFEVAQTCNPVTGIFDHPMVVFTISGILVLFGMYLLYIPSGEKLLGKMGDVTASVKRKVKNSEQKLKEELDPKRRFESSVLKRTKKK